MTRSFYKGVLLLLVGLGGCAPVDDASTFSFSGGGAKADGTSVNWTLEMVDEGALRLRRSDFDIAEVEITPLPGDDGYPLSIQVGGGDPFVVDGDLSVSAVGSVDDSGMLADLSIDVANEGETLALGGGGKADTESDYNYACARARSAAGLLTAATCAVGIYSALKRDNRGLFASYVCAANLATARSWQARCSQLGVQLQEERIAAAQRRAAQAEAYAEAQSRRTIADAPQPSDPPPQVDRCYSATFSAYVDRGACVPRAKDNTFWACAADGTWAKVSEASCQAAQLEALKKAGYVIH
jgi:hypothetical protein